MLAEEAANASSQILIELIRADWGKGWVSIAIFDLFKKVYFNIGK